MQWYPNPPDQRRRAITSDVLTVALLLLFAWAGWRVYEAVLNLTVFGQGIADAGNAVNDGFDSVAGAVDGIPLVGGPLSDALTSAGSGTGGSLADVGQQGVTAVEAAARLLGLLTFALPALCVGVALVPRRVRQIRRVTAASRLLAPVTDQQRRRLLAQRAAFGLPYHVLARYTDDPFGDLVHDNLDGLVRAALEDAGIAVG
jgi:hypothetical protein